MDYGRSLEFGYFLMPDAGDPRGGLETARLADRLGYDLLGAAATLDVLSGGRFEAGVGGGGFLRAAQAMGAPALTTFVLMGRADPPMLRTFIEDVAPGVRERVASARAVAGVR